MVVLDSSAVVAIVRGEPETEMFLDVLARASTVLVGAPTVVELGLVLGHARGSGLDAWLSAVGVEIVAFTAEHARVAREAHARFGRGSGHPARLNLGDVMSYSVAQVADAPLLFKGDDLTRTDITPAI